MGNTNQPQYNYHTTIDMRRAGLEGKGTPRKQLRRRLLPNEPISPTQSDSSSRLTPIPVLDGRDQRNLHTTVSFSAPADNG